MTKKALTIWILGEYKSNIQCVLFLQMNDKKVLGVGLDW